MAKEKVPAREESLLREAGLKVTRPRVALLRALIEDHGPFTIEELKARIPSKTCDPVTLYRSLPALEEAGLVRRCNFGDGAVRYEYQGSGGHHHHVICRSCRTVERLDTCLIEGLEQALRKQGYRDIQHSLEFFALCSRCAAEK